MVSGTDEFTAFGSQFDFRFDEVGSDVVVTDLRIPSDVGIEAIFATGQITLTSVEQVSVFGEDNPLTVESQLSKPIVERVFVQPIVVSDDDGSNTALSFW